MQTIFKKLSKKSIILIVSGLLLVLFSCKDNIVTTEDSHPFHSVLVDPTIQINELTYEEYPYSMRHLADPYNNPAPTDSNGIRVLHYHGQDVYQPLFILRDMQKYLDSYYQTHDSMYLDWVEKNYNVLMTMAVEDNNTLYFTYPFDFNIHNLEDDKMVSPWVSGICQGAALQVFTMWYRFTGESKYLEMADKIFKTFYYQIKETKFGIAYIDKENFLWFEEYPEYPNPNFTLNGFIAATFGLYEYYMITKNFDALFFLKASYTTIQHYLPLFRVPGGITYYCLKHKYQSPSYQSMHITQLGICYDFTGDKFFKDMADSLYNDYH